MHKYKYTREFHLIPLVPLEHSSTGPPAKSGFFWLLSHPKEICSAIDLDKIKQVKTQSHCANKLKL